MAGAGAGIEEKSVSGKDNVSGERVTPGAVNSSRASTAASISSLVL